MMRFWVVSQSGKMLFIFFLKFSLANTNQKQKSGELTNPEFILEVR